MLRYFCIAVVLSLPLALFAQEHSHMVRFDGKVNLDLTVNDRLLKSAGEVVYTSGASEMITEPFDRILFNGTLADTNVVLQISLESRGGKWTGWQDLKLHLHKGGRFWARFDLATASGGRIKYRFLDRGLKEGATIKIYAIETVATGKDESNSGGASRPAQTEIFRAAQDSVARPPVVTRAEWGANPPIGTYFPHDPFRFAQHHTAGRRVSTLEEGIAEQQFIQDFHQNGRGWQDIGYHYTIDDSGRIYEGVPPQFIGTHAGGNNTGNIGISYMGNFQITGEFPTEKAVNTLIQMWSWLSFEFSVNPDSLFGHRNYSATDCPGANLYARLPEMRTGIRNTLGFGAPYVADPQPQPFTREIEPNAIISVKLRDDEEGVDQNSIVMKVNGETVVPTIVAAGDEYRVLYQPPAPFNSSQNVIVEVQAADLANPPNVLVYSYKFTIKIDFLYAEVIDATSLRNGNIEVTGDWDLDLSDVALSGLNDGQRLLAQDSDNSHLLRVFPQVEETGDYNIFMAQQENFLGESAHYRFVNANGESYEVFKEYNGVYFRDWGRLSPVPVHFSADTATGYIELSGVDGIPTRLVADAFRLEKVDRLDIPTPPTFKFARVTSYENKEIELSWYPTLEGDIAGYRLYMSEDGRTWDQPVADEITLDRVADNYILQYSGESPTVYFRLVAVDTNAVESEEGAPEPLLSEPSDIYGVGLIQSGKILIVDNFDRLASWRSTSHPFVRSHGDALAANKYGFDSCTETVVQNGEIDLNEYALVVYFCGDDSRSDESLAAADQFRLLEYLQNGGNLFISGSEIGYDFDASPTVEKNRYHELLKATYSGDLSGSNRVLGVAGTTFEGLDFTYGTVSSEDTYVEDYPDYILPFGGSEVALSYDNLRNAAVQFQGTYSGGTNEARLIYIAFTFETIVDPADRSALMGRAMQFFDVPVGVQNGPAASLPTRFSLAQNYPNPFNPTTSIQYTVPAKSQNAVVKLEVFNLKGQQVAVLVDKAQTAGEYVVQWNGEDSNGRRVASGVYVYRLKTDNFVESRKMTLLR